MMSGTRAAAVVVVSAVTLIAACGPDHDPPPRSGTLRPCAVVLARRHPDAAPAFTVVLKEPPEAVARRWKLPTEDGWSHIVCMPGVTTARIDAFMRRLGRTMRPDLDRRPRPTTRRTSGGTD